MAMLRTGGLLAVASGLFSFLLLSAPVLAQAQGTLLRGRVADASDAPVAGAVVLLHAVGQQSGSEVARDTADEDGRFEITFQPVEGPLYFLATRIDGETFMAEPFREAPAGELVLRAGAGVEPLRLDGFEGSPPAGAAAVAEQEAEHDGWWVAAIAVVLVGLIVAIVHRGRHRAPRARELMVEIARLDEQRARAGGSVGDESYRTRRAELREQLIEALELDHDAHRH